MVNLDLAPKAAPAPHQPPAKLSHKAKLSTSAPCTTNVLNYETMNQTIKEVSYAVRGPIVAQALKIENELKNVSTHVV